jgi:hypothetical protein
LILIVAAGVFAAAAHAQTSSPANPAPAPQKDPPAPPIVFFIAKGEANACGPACSEWIAADGTFDPGAPARLRALLARHGKRKLPIFFHSPGGSVTAAMDVGRIMRAHKIKAGVGRTIPQGCDPKQRREKACDVIMRSGRELAAELRTRASCASACVYALIGAAEREVAPDAVLGVHSVSITRVWKLMNREGRVLVANSTKLAGNSSEVHDTHARLTRYAAEMGIGRGLIDAAAATPFETIRLLTRDEIAQFGIDRREFLEGPWMMEEAKSGDSYVGKIVITAKGGDQKHYRTTNVLMLCGRSGFFTVGLTRDPDPWDKPAAVAMAWPGAEIKLMSGRSPPPVGPGVAPRNMWTASATGIATKEMWVASTPKALLENATFGDSIDLVETPAGTASAPPRRIALSATGLASMIGTLAPRCR